MKKITIITGGSSGLGLSIAKKLVKDGENVAIIARSAEHIEMAEKEIKCYGDSDVISYVGDISNEEFVKKVFEEITKSYYINYLFNCAGVGRFGKPEDISLEMITTTFSASLVGLILMSSLALNHMHNGGTIVNVMSSAALKGNPLESVYCAAKWGARGFSEAIKAYTKGSKIKVISVYPGGMDTPFWNPQCGATPDTSKFMNVDEVADQIIFSVTERKSMYVGELAIDRR